MSQVSYGCALFAMTTLDSVPASDATVSTRACVGRLHFRVAARKQGPKSLYVRDEKPIPLEWLDESLSAKLLHGARHGFARRADLVRELFLRSIQLDLDANGSRDTGALSIAGEQHCQTRRDIPKRECLGEMNKMPQPAPQSADDCVSDVRLVAIEVLEGRKRKKNELTIFDRDCRRGVTASVENRKFGDGSAWALDMKDLFTASGVSSIDPNAA